MLNSDKIVGEFRNYLKNYGYSKNSLKNSGNNWYSFLSLNFRFNFDEFNNLELIVSHPQILKFLEKSTNGNGNERLVDKILDGSFINKYFSENVEKESLKYSSELQDITIISSEKCYKFSAKIKTNNSKTAFRAIFYNFIKPVLFCLRNN